MVGLVALSPEVHIYQGRANTLAAMTVEALWRELLARQVAEVKSEAKACAEDTSIMAALNGWHLRTVSQVSNQFLTHLTLSTPSLQFAPHLC